MAISSVSSGASIDSVLAQIRQVRQMVKVDDPGQLAAPKIESSSVSFSDTLKHTLARVNEAQDKVSGPTEAFALGKPGAVLNDAMDGLQKSGDNSQLGMYLRNKQVAAYQQVMNMKP